jgi:hypothetical protein
VVGEAGDPSHGDELALGETPNIAARLQGVAAPNTLGSARSRTNYWAGPSPARLWERTSQGHRDAHRGLHVLNESTARTRVEALGDAVTPLVGREHELGQLEQTWRDALAGRGRVVLVSVGLLDVRIGLRRRATR